METEAQFNEMINDLVRVTFRDAPKATIKEPQLAGFFPGTLKAQKKARAVRRQWGAKGVHVPPVMILSVTEHCYLHCAGCYSQSLRSVPKPEMGMEQMEKLFGEASELGLSIVLLSGGEPLMKPGLLDVSASGDLEPCPFAPYSDASLLRVSLKEALQSEFLRRIRDNSDELLEADGGCAIWKKREWAQALFTQSKEVP